MKRATRNDKERVVEILTQTFENNPGSIWLLRKGVDRRKGIRRLCLYVFYKALAHEGVYISSNKMGVAICYRVNKKRFLFMELFTMLWFAITSISLSRYPEVHAREKERERQRPVDGNYLYFWFFGVLPNGGDAAMELARELFREADSLTLPIYLETALPRMKPLYERFGFETYHFWEESEKNICFWFMKREPKL